MSADGPPGLSPHADPQSDKAADLAVEQPTKFELVVNLKTARVAGRSIVFLGWLTAAHNQSAISNKRRRFLGLRVRRGEARRGAADADSGDEAEVEQEPISDR